MAYNIEERAKALALIADVAEHYRSCPPGGAIHTEAELAVKAAAGLMPKYDTLSKEDKRDVDYVNNHVRPIFF